MALAVRWKLHNTQKMEPRAHKQSLAKLATVLNLDM